MLKAAFFVAALAVSLAGCAADAKSSEGDLSWLGAVLGGIIGFGLFFLVVFLASRSKV